MTKTSDVRAFYQAAGHTVRETPGMPSPEDKALRIKLHVEEFVETLLALVTDDLVGIADGVVDSTYINIGTALTYGIPFDEVWSEVHAADMRKVAGGVRKREDGKVLKPPGWVGPDVAGVLNKEGNVDTKMRGKYRYRGGFVLCRAINGDGSDGDVIFCESGKAYGRIVKSSTFDALFDADGEARHACFNAGWAGTQQMWINDGMDTLFMPTTTFNALFVECEEGDKQAAVDDAWKDRVIEELRDELQSVKLSALRPPISRIDAAGHRVLYNLDIPPYVTHVIIDGMVMPVREGAPKNPTPCDGCEDNSVECPTCGLKSHPPASLSPYCSVKCKRDDGELTWTPDDPPINDGWKQYRDAEPVKPGERFRMGHGTYENTSRGTIYVPKGMKCEEPDPPDGGVDWDEVRFNDYLDRIATLEKQMNELRARLDKVEGE